MLDCVYSSVLTLAESPWVVDVLATNPAHSLPSEALFCESVAASFSKLAETKEEKILVLQ